MKEFLKTNTVTYNLMSFTAFKSIFLFSILLDGPKSYNEMKELFENQEYLHEKISLDTLRNYINSLRKIGCVVNRKTVKGVTRYSIDSHPFTLKIDEKQIKSIIKVFKIISKDIEVTDLIALQKFFEKISNYIDNEELKTKLANISPLNSIPPKLINDLISYAQNNTEIDIYYNSATAGKKNITILVDKLQIINNKLYVYGVNSEYNDYASFLVNRIIKINSVNLNKKTLEIPEITVGYLYKKDDNEILELLENEKIISTDGNNLTIEICAKDKFWITQRIMSHSTKCKVLYPQEYKEYIISTFKKMKEGYIER